MAACSIANIVKSSLGPVGLDKMLVDDVGVRLVHFFVWSALWKLHSRQNPVNDETENDWFMC